jgi:hypothetical protein
VTSAAKARALRAQHKPDDVRVLFIGESPPTGPTFFYKGSGRLFSATKAAFVRAVPRLLRGTFLNDFMRLGCYLEDLCEEPVDKLRGPERKVVRRAGEPLLAARMEDLSPKAVIIVVSGVRPNIIRVLDTVGLGSVPRCTLPFPGRHFGLYVSELANMLASLRARRVLR